MKETNRCHCTHGFVDQLCNRTPTRLFCLFSDKKCSKYVRRFLHEKPLGCQLTDQLWLEISRDLHDKSNYRTNQGTSKRIVSVIVNGYNLKNGIRIQLLLLPIQQHHTSQRATTIGRYQFKL